ncbi:MAG: hypothetical protein LQ351_002151 [Letrouitia transgressa]|nr:MAG: hypothetical protein LQ351_002151 [Letrouitia transgressa]
MPSSCKDIRAALASCLQESDCMLVQRNKASDCLRPPLVDTLPYQCIQLKRGYGDCKRGMIDMRKRFRGNQSMAVGKEHERAKPAQLYANGLFGGISGSETTSGGVKATDGDEDLKEETVLGYDGERRVLIKSKEGK